MFPKGGNLDGFHRSLQFYVYTWVIAIKFVQLVDHCRFRECNVIGYSGNFFSRFCGIISYIFVAIS